MRIALLALVACATEPDPEVWFCRGTATCDGELIGLEEWEMYPPVEEAQWTWAYGCLDVHGDDGCTVLICRATCAPE